MSDAHELQLIPQSIADGWQGLCSCGQWKTFKSFYEIDKRDDLLAAIRAEHEAHVMEAKP